MAARMRLYNTDSILLAVMDQHDVPRSQWRRGLRRAKPEFVKLFSGGVEKRTDPLACGERQIETRFLCARGLVYTIGRKTKGFPYPVLVERRQGRIRSFLRTRAAQAMAERALREAGVIPVRVSRVRRLLTVAAVLAAARLINRSE